MLNVEINLMIIERSLATSFIKLMTRRLSAVITPRASCFYHTSVARFRSERVHFTFDFHFYFPNVTVTCPNFTIVYDRTRSTRPTNRCPVSMITIASLHLLFTVYANDASANVKRVESKNPSSLRVMYTLERFEKKTIFKVKSLSHYVSREGRCSS